MPTRPSLAISTAFHGVLLGALAFADDWLIAPPQFAVRSGYGVEMHSVASRASVAPVVFETRIDTPEPPPVEITAPPAVAEPAAKPEPPPPVPTSANLDHRPVSRSASAVVERQRTGRGAVASTVAADIVGPSDPIETDASVDIASEISTAAPVTESLTAPEPPPPERANVPAGPPITLRPLVIGDVIELGDSTVNSIAANQSSGAQVDQLPSSLPLNLHPVYPDDLRRRQIGGQVMLRVAIGPDGRVERVRVETSSGYREFDESAETAVRKWQFAPARQGSRPVRFEVRLPITFSVRRG